MREFWENTVELSQYLHLLRMDWRNMCELT